VAPTPGTARVNVWGEAVGLRPNAAAALRYMARYAVLIYITLRGHGGDMPWLLARRGVSIGPLHCTHKVTLPN